MHELIARAALLVDGHVLVCRARGASNTFLPGGHVESGEPIVSALRRELLEEGGLACTSAQPLGVVEHSWIDGERTRFEINHVFRVGVAGLSPAAAPVSLEPALELAWASLDDLDDLQPAPLRALLRLTAAGWRGAFFESTLPVTRDVVIRRVRPEDAERLRYARLYALAETPTSFGATLARDLAFPAERWLAWAATDGVTADETGRVKLTMVADDGDAIRGIATGSRGERLELHAMWVHAGYRGSGVAAKLVDEVLAWARARGETSISLFVSSPNARARALYTRLGFVPTGEIEPLPSRPHLTEERMVLNL